MYQCGLILVQLVGGISTSWLPEKTEQAKLLLGPNKNGSFWSYKGKHIAGVGQVGNINAWSCEISLELKDLVEALLHPQASERITAAAVCKHPFLVRESEVLEREESAYQEAMTERRKFV